MPEIKISVSDKLDKIIQKLADNLGIKKTEFVKSLVIENLKGVKK
ncbi:hypothetical protein ACFLZZ_02685 [Nanoarchaeota archaeon]